MAKTKISELENATQILHALESKQTALAEARAHDEATMAACSYEAHTGDQRAAAKLETLQGRAIKRDVEARNLASAIEEARRRVAAAQNAERNAEEMEAAEELLELATIMRDVGAKADKALKAFIEAANDIKKVIVATNQRGLANPSATQLQALGRRAILGQIVDSPFAKEFEHIAPRERQNFAAFTGSWASAIERFASQQLNIKGDGEESAA